MKCLMKQTAYSKFKINITSHNGKELQAQIVCNPFTAMHQIHS